MVFNLFKSKKNRSLGIDIGTSSVKIVELTKSGDEIELTNYGEYKGSTDATLRSSSVKLQSSQIADIIKEILKESAITAREATISVPVFSGFSTVISLPQMSDQELSQAVAFEAKKYIPLPLSEVQFEWMKILGTGAEQKPVESSASSTGQAQNRRGIQRQFSDIRVLIVAVTNELINRYHEIAKLSGLRLKYLELETFSLARSLASERGISSLIIDIGSRSTILSIVEDEWPMFTRSMDVSGIEFSKLLASSLGIDFARADELKRKNGVEAGGGILMPLIDNILQEAKRIIDTYTQKKKVAIGRVVLSGGSARMPGLLKYVVKSTGRETAISFPFDGIIYPEVLFATLRDMGPSFSVAVGASLREFK